jgi:hypothetical protein
VRFLRRFLIRLSNFVTRRSADQRLQDEIAEHLAFQTEENLRAGMSPAEARRQAALKFSVIDATLLHPLPYPNPAELVRVEDDLPGVGAQGVGISVPEWKDLESSGIFQSASITGKGANVNLSGSAQPLRLSFKQVTPN